MVVCETLSVFSMVKDAVGHWSVVDVVLWLLEDERSPVDVVALAVFWIVRGHVSVLPIEKMRETDFELPALMDPREQVTVDPLELHVPLPPED